MLKRKKSLNRLSIIIAHDKYDIQVPLSKHTYKETRSKPHKKVTFLLK